MPLARLLPVTVCRGGTHLKMVFWVSPPLLAYNRQWEEQLIEAPPCHCIYAWVCRGGTHLKMVSCVSPPLLAYNRWEEQLIAAPPYLLCLRIVISRRGTFWPAHFAFFLSSIGPGLRYSLPLSCNSCCLAQLGGAPSSHPHPLQKNISYDQTPQPSKGKGTIEFQKRISVKLTCHLSYKKKW